jgi:hypothetical protein
MHEADLNGLTALWVAAKEEEAAARRKRQWVEDQITGAMRRQGLERADTPCALVALKADYAWLDDAHVLLAPAAEYLSNPADRDRLLRTVVVPKPDGHVVNRLLRMGGQPREIVESARVMKGQRLEIRAQAILEEVVA